MFVSKKKIIIVNGLIELLLFYWDIVYMICIVYIVDYIDMFVNSYY